MALQDKQRPSDFTINETIANAIRARLQDGKLPCAAAFHIADEQQVTPLEVGRTADALEIHLTRCQLGLFGYPGHAKGWDTPNFAVFTVPEGLEEAVRNAADEENNVGCAALWEISRRFEIPRLYIGWFTDQLGIRISPCQLGAF
ncbi:MAG: hypothetical protein ACP5HM_00705 [Anaerolineae bacterium]